MSGRLLITSALMLVMAGPAFADCAEELQALDEAVVQAETGASPDAALPATPHQEQVLEGNQQGETGEGSGGPSSAGMADVPATPHQQQALQEAPSGEGDLQHPAELVADAREMAAAGDEEGCMQKVAEVKGLLGIE
jgi:hypothetical protein